MGSIGSNSFYFESTRTCAIVIALVVISELALTNRCCTSLMCGCQCSRNKSYRKELIVMKRISWMAILCVMFSAHADVDTDNIRTSVAIQSAGDLTDDTWTTEQLRYQSDAILEMSKKAAFQSFISNGGKASIWKPRTSNESNFVIVNGRKFGIIRHSLRLTFEVNASNTVTTVNVIKILAIKGSDLMSVTCLRHTDKEISLAVGQCNDAIKKYLGVDFAM